MNNQAVPHHNGLHPRAEATPTLAPQPTLRSYALAALSARIGDALANAPDQPEQRYLAAHLQRVDPLQRGWSTTLLAYLSEPAAGDLPLLQLAQTLRLTVFELLVIALAAAVEDELMVGRALAYLQAPLGGSRPTLGLVDAVFADALGSQQVLIDLLLTGVAVRCELLLVLGDGAPLPERSIRLPLHLGLALKGIDGAWPGTTIGLGSAPAIPLPPSLLTEAQRQGNALRPETGRALVVRTAAVAEGKAVAAAIAQALGQRPLFIATSELTGLTPWLLLRRLLPVFCLNLAPGEQRVLPPLPDYQGPILVLCGPDGSVELVGETTLHWTLGAPPRAERQQLWQQALQDDTLAAQLARDHRHGSGRIAQLGRLAHHQRLLAGRAALTTQDILAAAWSGEGGGLDALAQPLPDPVADAALVVTSTLRRELELLLMRCRARDGLVTGLGASAQARYRPGVRALLVGPSGTGKTLAAGWLATQLGLPLYRVDLAAVTSKYIGETEKNLAQLLARAEAAEVVLLFDEADSLFGKRTEVQQANDRFANAQTNYLLQRIEAYDGITLLTSNSRSRFDSAFARRLDLIIEFPLPGPKERRALWLSHLGEQPGLRAQELNRLAASADLAGGDIRNVVLAAAVLAQSARRPLVYADLVEGLASEYRKQGKQLPTELKA